MRSSESLLGPWPYLDRAWNRKRLAQSLLLVGAGDWARDAAHAVIRRVLCEGEGRVDCPCRSCDTTEEAHPDFVGLLPSPKTIRLDAVQRALGRAGVAPLWSPSVVVWISQVTAMTPEAENSLLKSLEEPPEYVQYVLSVDRLDRVLATVRSRCQAVSVEDLRSPAVDFEIRWLRDRNRDLAEDLLTAAHAVREELIKSPSAGLYGLFSVLWQAREGMERNHNLDLIREIVEMAWENVFGRP